MKSAAWMRDLLTRPVVMHRIAAVRPRRLSVWLYSSPLMGISSDALVEVTVASGRASGLRMELAVRSREAPQALHYWLGFHEIPVQEALGRLVYEGQTAYDVGAYVGFFSLILGRLVGSRGSVIAFDPVIQNCERIARHATMNSMSWVTAMPVAAATQRAMVTWNPGGRGDWGSVSGEPGRLSVRTTSLDELVFDDGYPPPNLIKIDVEGSEGFVLKGAGRILRTYRPSIVCELHGPGAAAVVRSELAAAGYQLYSLSLKLVKAPSPVGHIVALPSERVHTGRW